MRLRSDRKMEARKEPGGGLMFDRRNRREHEDGLPASFLLSFPFLP